MAAEVSQEDKKFIQGLLTQKKEEQLYLGTLHKGEKKKAEQKVILVTQHRVYIIKAGEHKVHKESHLLDLVEIRSPNSTEITLIFKSFEIDGSTSRADDIITNIRQAYELTFFGTPEDAAFKLNVQPASRIVSLATKELPLGGFVNTYVAICDYHGHPPRDEICWDMEHTYSTKNIKTFDLSEFEQPLHAHDIKALLTSLRFNKHFTSLVVCDIPFAKEQIQVLADTLRTNAVIETLKLASIGARADAVTLLCSSLSANKNIAVTELDVSNNPLEDKGIQAVANFISATPRGLVSLNASHTGLGKAGTAALGVALKKNFKTSATLFYLNLDGNKLEAEGSSAIAAYLATPNSLRELHIASTNPSLETIIGALIRGCTELRHVNLSDNKMTKKDATLLTRIIAASSSLKQITLNRTAIPPDALKEILVAIGGNVYLQDFVIEAKGNELGHLGAQAVAEAAPRLSNLHTLDLDDNDLGDDGICAVADGLCSNTFLKRLDLSRNYKIAKTKTRAAMLESLSNLLSSECPLESLILAGSAKAHLKGEIVSLIYDLATNASLLELDISGQQMGNRGAVALGKTLQTNNTLTTLSWDDNQTTIAGFQSFKTGIERNHSIKVMPLPILDISATIRTDPPHRVQQVIADIEKALSRNQSPGRQFEANKSSALGSFTVLTSGQQQNIDKLVMKIKSTGQKIEDRDGLNVIQDASSTEKFVAGLHLMREATYQAAEEEMQNRLKAFAEQASDVLKEKKSELVSHILKTLQDSFLSMDQQSLRRLHTGIEFGSKDLDQAELETILVKATGAELSSKANETFLSCVEIASDYVYEKMEDRLHEIYNDLETSRPAAPASPAFSRAQSSPHTSVALPSSPLGLSSETTSTPPTSSPVDKPRPETPPSSSPVVEKVDKSDKTEKTEKPEEPEEPEEPEKPEKPEEPEEKPVEPPRKLSVSSAPPSKPPPAAPATVTSSPPDKPPPATPGVVSSPPDKHPPATPATATHSPTTTSLATSPPATTATSPAPAKVGPPKPAPRVIGTASAPPATTTGRVAAVSGNAAVAAAIARGVAAGPGGPPSPSIRPAPPSRPVRDPSTFLNREDSKELDTGKKEESPATPKKDEPATPKKEDASIPKKELSKDELKKEKEKKEKEEKDRKEREKKEKEEKEKKDKEKAKAEKAEKEKKEKEKKEKEKKEKEKGKTPVKGKDLKSVSSKDKGLSALPALNKPKEQELVHLTKDRAKGPGGNRKPPTRRPRPPTAPDES